VLTRRNSQLIAGTLSAVLLALMVVVLLDSSRATVSTVVFTPPAVGHVCEQASGAASCPTLTATSKGSVSHDQVNNFLQQLFNLDQSGQAPSVAPGALNLQRCSSRGTGPFRVTCTFFLKTSTADLDLVQTQFIASGLFASLQVQHP